MKTATDKLTALLEAATKVRDALDRGEHPGSLASILDAAIEAAADAESAGRSE